MRQHPTPENPRFGVEVGHRLIEVKRGVTGLRSVRAGLIQLAYAVAARPDTQAFLVLPGVAVTKKRLEREWQLASSVLRPDLRDRLSLCIKVNGRYVGIPRDPDPSTQRVLSRLVEAQPKRKDSRPTRGDASFVVTKVLLHHFLTDGKPVTTGWLADASGYSYPTIAGVLHGLGSLIERQSDRRLRLRWFPREEFARLLAISNRARATVRFGDRSGHPRSPESHVRRLQALDPPGLAIGGVLGAKHHFPDLDVVGTPRLDLSQHAGGRHLELDFIAKLDPALERLEDPLAQPAVVVHAVRHSDPLFQPREGWLQWADPVECLLDLHEARLEIQASQFLEGLLQRRAATQ